jgi:hypothetical protein
MIKKIFFLISLFVVFSLHSFAQFKLDAQIRPLGEYRRGYDRMPFPDDKPSAFIVQRTRLNFQHTHQRVTSFISFQDVRTFGEEEQKRDEPSLTLHQGWVEVEAHQNLFFRVGRQEIQYDRGHIIGANNWNDNQQKHDLVMVKLENNEQRIHLATALNNAGQPVYGTPYNVDNYKFMQILWAYTPFSQKRGTLSLLAFADAYEDVNNSDILNTRGNFSAFMTYDFSVFNMALNPAFQNGKTPAGQNIEAYYLMAEVGSSFADNHEISLGFEFNSGNDLSDAGDNKLRVFDPTYSRSNGPNGYMDYFTDYPRDTGGAGFWNYYFKNSVKITPKFTANLDIHAFFLSNDYVFRYGTDEPEIQRVNNRFLGLEPDLVLEYQFNDFTELQFGYSFMLGTESMEIVKGGDRNEWAQFSYLMLTVKPQIFGY